ncbi:metalloregulator ArsR/SmtB family transcription factor [Brachybacterium paraconglomeratum]|uniref:ArsR/SmtB family transcription factor n=1 Tax=Brachybacterium paraconglomeratum TaxID=173362 RepID=UPI0031EF9D98
MTSEHPLHVRADDVAPVDEDLVEELRGLLGEVSGFVQLAERLALLSDPRRLQILFCLHAHPGVRSSDLARAIQAHDSTTSHALALLRDAGWVRAQRSGREVRYELADGLAHEILHALGSDHLPGVDHAHTHPHGTPGGAPDHPKRAAGGR